MNTGLVGLLTRVGARWGSERLPVLPLVLAVALVAAAIVAWRMLNLPEAGAYFGFSPTALTFPFWDDPGFARDFPGGEAEMLKSAIMPIYPLLGGLGVDKSLIFGLMIALEVAVLAAGTVVATITLNRHASIGAGLVTALLLVASTLINCNLARWGHPYYGSVYNFAYGAGMAAAALLIGGRMIVGAVLLATTIVLHPLLGMLFGLFAGLAILADIRRYRWTTMALAVVLTAALAAPWLLSAMQGAGVTGSSVPADLYIAVTRMMSYHWFPISLGVLGSLSYESTIPLSGFFVLLTIYLGREGEPLTPLERQVVVALTGVAAISVVGVFLAEYSGSPFVTKLALHRASSIALLIASLFVVPGLLRDVLEGPIWRAVLAAAMLVLPFFTVHGIPVSLTLALGAGVLISAARRRAWNARTVAIGVALASALVILAILVIQGQVAIDDRIIGHYGLLNPVALLLIALVVSVRFLRHPLVLPLAFAALALVWAPNARSFVSDGDLARARDYLAVQRWAQTETPVGALFMVDPAHAYGWREYALRPSFGSVREWLYGAWAYNTHAEVFAEGVRRFEAFGLDLDHYIEQDRLTPGYGKERIGADLREKYYGFGRDWFERMAAEYGIDYFVFDRAYVTGENPVPVVFENDSYVVGRLGGSAE